MRVPVPLLIAAKDARQRLRDFSLLLYAVLVPLGLAFVLSLVIGGADGDDVFRYAVVDEDGGPVAATFTDEFLPAVAADGAIAVTPVGSTAEAEALVADGEVAAAFVVPPGFSTLVEAGQPAAIYLIGDVDAPLGAQVGRALAEAYAGDLTGVQLSMAAAAGADRPEALAARARSSPAPIGLVDDPTATRALDTSTFFSAGMAVFFLFFTVQFGVSSLLAERRHGTMARLLAAPIRPGAILAGKLLSSYTVGVLSMATLVVATSLLLGARWGNPVGVAVLVVTGVAAANGVMALVASLARTADQASGWQTILAVVMGALGGAFFPVAMIGGVLGVVSYLTPHRWFLQGLSDLAGGDLSVVWLPALALLAFATVTGGIAVLRIRKLVQP